MEARLGGGSVDAIAWSGSTRDSGGCACVRSSSVFNSF